MGTPMDNVYGSRGPTAHGGFDDLAPGGGMDPIASLKKHSDFATRFQGNPTGGMGAVGIGPFQFGTGGMNYGGG